MTTKIKMVRIMKGLYVSDDGAVCIVRDARGSWDTLPWSVREQDGNSYRIVRRFRTLPDAGRYVANED